MTSRLLILLFSLLTLGACHIERPGQETTEVSIAYLKSLCSGQHYRISADYRLRGVIVASEWLGELSNSIIVKDGSGYLEVMVDVADATTRLPIYSEVEIYCNGLVLARVGGKIEMGMTSTGDFVLDNIGEDMINSHIRIIGIGKEFTPETKRFEEIDANDISSIVHFEKVRIADEEQGLRWCDILDGEAVTTYRTLVDNEGNRFALRTLSTCTYAYDEMPSNEISVIGAIDYADDRYFITIVNGWITQ